MFRLFDMVRLKQDDIDAGVLTSYRGTVVDVPAEGVYTVEFFDKNGDTVMDALFKTYTDEDLEAIGQ